MLFLAAYRMFKSTETLSSDNPVETDVVRRSPTSEMFSCPLQPGIEPETALTPRPPGLCIYITFI